MMNDDVFYSVFRELLLVLSLVRRNKIHTSTLSYYKGTGYNEKRVVWRVENVFVEGMKEIRDLWGIEESRFLELSVVRNQKRKKNRKKSRGG